jgi:osomolarity two-component system, sensor histidine kinase NIK1
VPISAGRRALLRSSHGSLTVLITSLQQLHCPRSPLPRPPPAAQVGKLGQFAQEVTRVAQEVGTEGSWASGRCLPSRRPPSNLPTSKLGGQALVLDVEGTWRDLTGVVNKLAPNLTSQVRAIATVTTAVALGDLSKEIDVDARGEILELKTAVNGMVVRLRALAAEVTRVALEVGSQGKLGGQAAVPNVDGVWLQLVTNVSWAPLSAFLTRLS